MDFETDLTYIGYQFINTNCDAQFCSQAVMCMLIRYVGYIFGKSFVLSHSCNTLLILQVNSENKIDSAINIGACRSISVAQVLKTKL